MSLVDIEKNERMKYDAKTQRGVNRKNTCY